MGNKGKEGKNVRGATNKFLDDAIQYGGRF
jgi:hypothetical protein